MYEISEILDHWMQKYGQINFKIPPKLIVSPICDPQDFFQKSGSTLLYPYGEVTSYAKFKESNGHSLRYLKAV